MALGTRSFVAVLLLASCLTACGGNSGSSSNNNGRNSGGSNSTPHVVVVVFENQDYADLIGNTTSLPYLNQLANQNALATQFHANVHPSIGNYFLLTTGRNPTGNDDAWSGTFSGSSIASILSSAGKTWKVYAESLPSVGYIGDDRYPYIKHHNPFAYFDSVRNGSSQKNNIVPLSQFATDVASNSLPSFALVVPNNLHNSHDCPDGSPASNCPLADRLAAIDSFLNTNVAPVIGNSPVMSNTILAITFDEAATDSTNGGGRIPLILLGNGVKTNFQSTSTYQIPSLLRFTLDRLGGTTCPGESANAANMSEFLK